MHDMKEASRVLFYAHIRREKRNITKIHERDATSRAPCCLLMLRRRCRSKKVQEKSIHQCFMHARLRGRWAASEVSSQRCERMNLPHGLASSVNSIISFSTKFHYNLDGWLLNEIVLRSKMTEYFFLGQSTVHRIRSLRCWHFITLHFTSNFMLCVFYDCKYLFWEQTIILQVFM